MEYHYISRGKHDFIAKSKNRLKTYPIIKMKGKIEFNPESILLVEIQAPRDITGNRKYKLNPEGYLATRQLNKRIITSIAPDRNGKVGKVVSNYPIPTIESLLARLEGCKYFSILDLRSGYHHIGLSEVIEIFNSIYNTFR